MNHEEALREWARCGSSHHIVNPTGAEWGFDVVPVDHFVVAACEPEARMKLEEVLPAMREGRVAVDEEGHGWRMMDGRVVRPVRSGHVYDSPPLDGWTLEPEPKVEWPKNSLPWAMAQIPKVPDGHCYALCLRGRMVPFGASIGMDDAASLEWSLLS